MWIQLAHQLLGTVGEQVDRTAQGDCGIIKEDREGIGKKANRLSLGAHSRWRAANSLNRFPFNRIKAKQFRCNRCSALCSNCACWVKCFSWRWDRQTNVWPEWAQARWIEISFENSIDDWSTIRSTGRESIAEKSIDPGATHTVDLHTHVNGSAGFNAGGYDDNPVGGKKVWNLMKSWFATFQFAIPKGTLGKSVFSRDQLSSKCAQSTLLDVWENQLKEFIWNNPFRTLPLLTLFAVSSSSSHAISCGSKNRTSAHVGMHRCESQRACWQKGMCDDSEHLSPLRIAAANAKKRTTQRNDCLFYSTQETICTQTSQNKKSQKKVNDKQEDEHRHEEKKETNWLERDSRWHWIALGN